MKTVLIVDDDASFLEMMKGALDASKYTVVTAADGQIALEQAANHPPDVILLDVNMPRMNGMEFLAKYNEKHGMGKTPVIITSNISSMDKISEGVELGIRGYIIKSTESIAGIVAAVDRVFA